MVLPNYIWYILNHYFFQYEKKKKKNFDIFGDSIYLDKVSGRIQIRILYVQEVVTHFIK